MLEPIEPWATRPVFVDASGRRAVGVRRASQVVGLLILVYFALLAASLARLPGTSRVSLPVVGRLFPEATPKLPPSVEAAPNVTVLATGGRGPVTATTRRSTPTSPPAPAAAATAPAQNPAGNPLPAPESRGSSGTRSGSASNTPGNPDNPGNSGTGATSPPSGGNGRGPDGSGPPGQQQKSETDGGSQAGGPQGNGNGRGGGNPD